MKVIAGPASEDLGKEVAKRLNVPAIPVFHKAFPDGESYIRFGVESLRNEDVVIVQTTSPPQDQRLIQLFLMADNALDLKAKSITAVLPYFAYLRQDKRFLGGEAFSAKTITRLLEACGVVKIVTINAHNPAMLRISPVPVEDLSAIALLAEHYRFQGMTDNPVSLSLGKKALNMAKEANSILKGGYDYISTKRDTHSGTVALEQKEMLVRNRDVIIFDDIISSGETMAKAVKYAKGNGAKRVYATCVHPLLTGSTYRKILESGAEGIIGTDCVPSSVSKVSVAPLIVDALTKQGV